MLVRAEPAAEIWFARFAMTSFATHVHRERRRLMERIEDELIEMLAARISSHAFTIAAAARVQTAAASAVGDRLGLLDADEPLARNAGTGGDR